MDPLTQLTDYANQAYYFSIADESGITNFFLSFYYEFNFSENLFH